MAYSTQRATSDGTLVLLDISIEYFDRSEIAVLFNGVIGAYPWAWVGDTEKKISFSPAVPNTVEVMLVRTTDLAAVRHMFTLGAQFTTQSLDEDLLQILHIVQEAKENATIEEVFHNLNMHGYRITSIGDGIDPRDAPSMAQLSAHDVVIVGYMNAAEASADDAATSAAEAAASAASLLPGVPLGIATLDGAGKVVQTALTADVATSAGTSANLAGRAQLGTDSNATRNFTLTAEDANGTLKLARGNAGATTQDILTVDAAGKVAFPAGSNEIGVGQTWQDMTGLGGRTLGAAAVTNSSGRPIQVSVRCSSSANSSNQVKLTIDGIIVAHAQTSESNGAAYGGSGQTLSAIVPAGSTYGVANSVGVSVITAWLELR